VRWANIDHLLTAFRSAPLEPDVAALRSDVRSVALSP
jgi:hypothetical protein